MLDFQNSRLREATAVNLSDLFIKIKRRVTESLHEFLRWYLRDATWLTRHRYKIDAISVAAAIRKVVSKVSPIYRYCLS
jgi:hypothetical protein